MMSALRKTRRGRGITWRFSEVNRARDRRSDGRLKRRGVSEVNTMEAVISDGGHPIPRTQWEATGSDYCLLPVCCSTLPLTL